MNDFEVLSRDAAESGEPVEPKRDAETPEEPEEGAPRRVVLYSPHTRRIFTPRLDDRPAVDLAKPVGTLASARKLVKALVLDGKFEPVPGGWV